MSGVEGRTVAFRYYGGGTEALRERTGERVEVLRELGDSERDVEVGRMFRVRFPDGLEADVFAEEVASLIEAGVVVAAEVARLVGLYGDDPAAVGRVDGTEDDYGDLLVDSWHALGLPGAAMEADDGRWERFQEAAQAVEAASMQAWLEALAVWLAGDVAARGPVAS